MAKSVLYYWSQVAVWLHYHCILHGQLGRLLDRVSFGDAGDVVGWSLEAVQDQVLADEQLRRHGLLPEEGVHRGEVLPVSLVLLFLALWSCTLCCSDGFNSQVDIRDTCLGELYLFEAIFKATLGKFGWEISPKFPSNPGIKIFQ